MKHVMAKFIPQLLLPEQKEHCAAFANDLIQTATSEPDFLMKVISGHELSVCGYDPEIKSQLSQCKLPGSPCPKKAQQSQQDQDQANWFCCCCCWEGAIPHKYAPSGQTIHTEYYLNARRWLRDAI